MGSNLPSGGYHLSNNAAAFERAAISLLALARNGYGYLLDWSLCQSFHTRVQSLVVSVCDRVSGFNAGRRLAYCGLRDSTLADDLKREDSVEGFNERERSKLLFPAPLAASHKATER